jgi:hypothetical protein
MKKVSVVVFFVLFGLMMSCKSPQEQMLEKRKTDVEKAIEAANDDKPSEGTIRFCKLAAGWRDDACKEAKAACDAAQKNRNDKKARANCEQKKKTCQQKEQEYNERCSKIKQ